MILREPCLPPGWYPRDRAKITEFLEPISNPAASSASAVAPHAGWFYSGRTAAIAVSALQREVETVVVIGGHLPKECLFSWQPKMG